MKKTLLIPLAIIGGVLAIENKGPQRERDCMTFIEPHTFFPDPEITYTFKEDNGELYGVKGHPKLLASLESGERYRPTVTDPLIGDDRLIFATPCE